MARSTGVMAAVLGTAVAVVAAASSAGAVEQPPYEVVEKRDDVELRRYGSIVVVETEVPGEFEAAGNVAFRRLFDYISGANQGRRKIAMTAPVVQSAGPEKIAMTAPVVQERGAQGWRVAFILPSELTLSTAPEPTDPQLSLRELPARTVAAIRFSGTWSADRFAEREARVRATLAELGMEPDGAAVWARYDPPFMPWFLRRNEVLIPVSGR